MSNNSTIYAAITERVIAQLEAGVVPWRKPWAAGSGAWPKNLKSGKNYRGINVFLLGSAGYQSPVWGTYNQLAEAAGMTRAGSRWVSPDGTPRGVRAGEKSQMIIFWKRLWIEETDPATGAKSRKLIPMLRYFYVFNVEQADGLPEKYRAPVAEVTDPGEALHAGQDILDGYLAQETAPSYAEDGGDKAYYDPSLDEIHIPARGVFDDGAKFYSTAFHEMAHSTGHAKRCNRPGVSNFDHFGSEKYSKEELVAEMGAAFLMGTSAIDTADTFENSAAYLDSWVKKLAGDPKLIISAAAQAQHAADHILGIKFENTEES